MSEPRKKLSLVAQIGEVDRELAERKRVYERLIAQRKLRQSHADFQMAHMQAVRDTLQWLIENEPLVREVAALLKQRVSQ